MSHQLKTPHVNISSKHKPDTLKHITPQPSTPIKHAGSDYSWMRIPKYSNLHTSTIHSDKTCGVRIVDEEGRDRMRIEEERMGKKEEEGRGR